MPEVIRRMDLSQIAADPAAQYAWASRSMTVARQTAEEIAAFTSGFMPPGQPLPAIEPPGTPARRWDYPASVNINYTPRAGMTSFSLLQNLAAWDPVRYCIEERKNRIKARKWAIVPIDEGDSKTDKYDAQIAALTKYWACPDGETAFDLWVSQLLEDSFVYDAATICRWPTRDGKGVAQHVTISGKTISPILDVTGRRPRPPLPAYRQIIKGIVWDNFTSDQLLYCPRNPSNDSAYGVSEVEWLMMTINIALRRDTYDLATYTDGNAPAGFLGAPENWTPDQIRTYQTFLDSLLAGNAQKRSRVMVVPGGFDLQRWVEREEDKYVKFSEFVVRRACAIFHVSPEAYTAQVNRATAEVSDDRQAESADEQLMQWIAGIITREIQTVQGQPDLQFSFVSERKQDQLKAAQAEEIEVRNGKRSLDEVRVAAGLDEIGIPPFVMTGSGPVYLRGQNPEYQARYKKFFDELDAQEQADREMMSNALRSAGGSAKPTKKPGSSEEDPDEQSKAAAALVDLRKWRKVALRCAKDRKTQKSFDSASIPGEIKAVLEKNLHPGNIDTRTINRIFAAAEQLIE